MCVLVVPADGATVVDRKCVELGLDWAGEISGRLGEVGRFEAEVSLVALLREDPFVRLVRPG